MAQMYSLPELLHQSVTRYLVVSTPSMVSVIGEKVPLACYFSEKVEYLEVSKAWAPMTAKAAMNERIFFDNIQNIND